MQLSSDDAAREYVGDLFVSCGRSVGGHAPLKRHCVVEIISQMTAKWTAKRSAERYRLTR